MNPIREKLKNLMAILPRILSMAASAISAFSPAPQDFLLKMMKSFSFSFWLPGKARLAIASIVLSGGLGLLGTPAWSETAQPGQPAEAGKAGGSFKHPDHGSLEEIGATLANPLGNIWALQGSFSLPAFYDGDVNQGSRQFGASMAFQPVMPIPLYGTGKNRWQLITRPVIPIIFTSPVPKGFDNFNHLSGIGDIQIPLLVAFPESISGNFILGAGPVGWLPTATHSELGRDQWGMGPAAVVGYKNKFMTVGVFPNYYWKIAGAGQSPNNPDMSQGSLLYFLNFNLPDAWQIGMNPTISYNDKARSGNKWTVPVGLYAAKTVAIGTTPVNIKAGIEYSLVSPDDFGEVAQIKIQITPVIKALIQNPILGQ